MIKFLLLLLIAFPAYSISELKLEIEADSIRQGSLVNGQLIINPTDLQIISLQQLKGQNISGLLYFYEVSPAVKRDELPYFTADVKIIFIKIPEVNYLKLINKGDEIVLRWENINIIPTDSPPEMILREITVPETSHKARWIALSVLSALIMIVGLFWLFKKYKLKKQIRDHKTSIKNEILESSSYDDIVKLWLKKNELFDEFPHIKDSFSELEVVLNRYQFKSSQNESEKEEVVKAFKTFISKIEGGFYGI